MRERERVKTRKGGVVLFETSFCTVFLVIAPVHVLTSLSLRQRSGDKE